ncbi:hypothetical protein FO440_23320 [Mucilaginibacter corticis]|uniref:Uncharacterized protein n=1 Tax=Mucilaginibacter corticis TaxID=2597670 RepID=A0A556M930_9SPHI|nr:hypothetical protein [Mucilaginibacter corticis]TSJ36434.1 hypothetical protein FO440_23320 [Mucilaginibacter corticis]
MHSTTYFLSDEANDHVIVHEVTGLRVQTFSLEQEPFYPQENEIHLFGDDHGEWLAFETIGWKGEPISVLEGAMIWYARYLDYPEMLITEEDPRPVNPMWLS